MWLDLDLDSSGSYQAYVDAHAKWSSIILSDSHGGQSVNVESYNLGADGCPAGMPDLVDDLYICGRDECIDGPYGILGSAGPRLTYNGITLAGKMRFDKDDVARYVPSKIETWRSVILHEMGHVLGLNSGLFGSGKPLNVNNQFIGTNAVSVWQNDWGCTGNPPIETDGGTGYVISFCSIHRNPLAYFLFYFYHSLDFLLLVQCKYFVQNRIWALG